MNPNPHLTEAELYDLLDRPDQAPAPDHLAGCPRCQSELTQLRETLTGLRIATTNLALAQQVHLTRPDQSSSLHAAYPVRKLFAWSAPFAIAAVALSVMLLHPHPTAAPSAGATNTPAGQSTLSDAALLDAVAQDLSTSVPPSLEPLTIATSSTSNQN